MKKQAILDSDIYKGLLLEFGTGTPTAIRVCAKYFGIESPAAVSRAAKEGKLPVPCFSLGSQKSPFLVRLSDLAAYIEKQYLAAKIDFDKLNG